MIPLSPVTKRLGGGRPLKKVASLIFVGHGELPHTKRA